MTDTKNCHCNAGQNFLDRAFPFLVYIALAVLLCALFVWYDTGSRAAITAQQQRVQWMNDRPPPQPGDIANPCGSYFVFGLTNEVELGIRSDGVVVWRPTK